MTTNHVLGRYLSTLEQELRFTRDEKRRILLEAEDHLLEDAARDEASGVAAEDAERRAVRRFGDPRAVARRFAEEQPPVVTLRGVTKNFPTPSGGVYTALREVSLEVRAAE